MAFKLASIVGLAIMIAVLIALIAGHSLLADDPHRAPDSGFFSDDMGPDDIWWKEFPCSGKSHGRRGSDIRALWIRSPSNLRSCALVHLDRYPFTFFDDEPGSGHVCGYRCRVENSR